MKLDRLDVDELERFLASPVAARWAEKIEERCQAYQRTLERCESDERAIRNAQGALEALRFVKALPTTMRKEATGTEAAKGPGPSRISPQGARKASP